MKNELENVKAKESKTSLKITEIDRQRLFTIASELAEMNGNNEPFTPLEAFRICLSLTEDTIVDQKMIRKHTNDETY